MDLRTLILALTVAVGACACSVADGGDGLAPAISADPAATSPVPGPAVPTATQHVDPRRGGLELGFGEFAITLEAREIRPGPVTFVIRNGGQLIHGFEIEIREQGDSSGHGSGHDGLKLEGPAFGPGESIRIPTDLASGVYEIECFVAEHDDMGMRATLIVRNGAPLLRVDPRPAGDQVEIAGFAFAPTPLQVPVGTVVTWANLDPAAHTVTARDGSFDSGTLEPDVRFETTFARAGTFDYFCQIHPTMRGSVRVEEPG
jgi:plastocyanin